MKRLTSGGWWTVVGFVMALTGLVYLLLGHGPLLAIYDTGVPYCNYSLNGNCPLNPAEEPLRWVAIALSIAGASCVFYFGRGFRLGRLAKLAAIGLFLFIALYFVLVTVFALSALRFD